VSLWLSRQIEHLIAKKLFQQLLVCQHPGIVAKIATPQQFAERGCTQVALHDSIQKTSVAKINEPTTLCAKVGFQKSGSSSSSCACLIEDKLACRKKRTCPEARILIVWVYLLRRIRHERNSNSETENIKLNVVLQANLTSLLAVANHQ